jgi:hypothetical protein
MNQMMESQLRDMNSKREVEKFNAVRELEKSLAFPSTSDLVEIVSIVMMSPRQMCVELIKYCERIFQS